MKLSCIEISCQLGHRMCGQAVCEWHTIVYEVEQSSRRKYRRYTVHLGFLEQDETEWS